MESNQFEYATSFAVFAASSFAALLVFVAVQAPGDLIRGAAALQAAVGLISLLDALATTRALGVAPLVFGTLLNSLAGAAAAVAVRPADPAALAAAAGFAATAFSALLRRDSLPAAALLCLSLELVALFVTQSV